MSDIIVGSAPQVRTVQRANAIWALLQDDPRFAFQGRSVSLAGEVEGTAHLVVNLCRLQGYASCHFAERTSVERLSAVYQTAGLSPLVWEQYWGREKAIEQSRTFLKSYSADNGVRLRTVTASTSDETLLSICEMSQEAGVLPAPGSVMRGLGPRSVFIYAETADSEIIAIGGACMAYHPNSMRSDEAFWGMLATKESWRGKRLACWVGAQVILDMAERYGAKGFSSGVKPDNPSSQAMCSRLGVTQSDYVYVGAIDPNAFGEASVTR